MYNLINVILLIYNLLSSTFFWVLVPIAVLGLLFKKIRKIAGVAALAIGAINVALGFLLDIFFAFINGYYHYFGIGYYIEAILKDMIVYSAIALIAVGLLMSGKKLISTIFVSAGVGMWTSTVLFSALFENGTYGYGSIIYDFFCLIYSFIPIPLLSKTLRMYEELIRNIAPLTAAFVALLMLAFIAVIVLSAVLREKFRKIAIIITAVYILFGFFLLGPVATALFIAFLMYLLLSKPAFNPEDELSKLEKDYSEGKYEEEQYLAKRTEIISKI